MKLKAFLNKHLKMTTRVNVTKNKSGRYTVTEFGFDGWGETVKHYIHGNDYSRAEAYAKRREILACHK